MAKKQEPSTIRVRILVDSGEYRCNTVVEIDAVTAAALVRDGIADATPEAVSAVE